MRESFAFIFLDFHCYWQWIEKPIKFLFLPFENLQFEFFINGIVFVNAIQIVEYKINI